MTEGNSSLKSKGFLEMAGFRAHVLAALSKSAVADLLRRVQDVTRFSEEALYYLTKLM